MTSNPLLSMARTMGNPVLEEDLVTFVWQGTAAPLLMDDSHHWQDEPQEMSQLGPGLWSCTFQLPAGCYVEYAFILPSTGERLPDPLNPQRVVRGSRDFKHYFYMPPGQPTPLIRPVKDTARGKVTRHRIPTREYAVGGQRSVILYQPAVMEPVPLLVVYDGLDYLQHAKLNIIVDNLIAEQRIQPIALAMVASGGAARTLEYSCSESTLDFVFECVVSLAQEQLVLKAPGIEPYGVLGASLGGLCALYTGMRLPQVFGKVLSQSGCFDVSDFPGVIVDLARYLPRTELEVWMDAGKFDWDLENNQEMARILREKKYRVEYHEYAGGHNFSAWRDDIGRGLEALFGRK